MSGIVNKVKETLHGDKHHNNNNVPEGTHGPHGSRVANAADPRVDSDLDSTRPAGATRTAGHGEFGSGNAYTTGGTGAMGTGTTAGASFEPAHTHTGHNANVPAYEGYGAGSGATGVTGTHGAPAGTFGPHGSRMANTVDPRVDSDRDGRGAVGYAPGPAPNTAGPHRNDVLNKADPRVDSDLDNSRTLGGNKTFHQ
jgi:hypothetical protein